MAIQDNKKTLIIDVMDAYYYKDGDLVFYSENLTSSNLTNKVDQDEVRNGKGNMLFAMLNKKKSASVELNSNVFSFATVALQSGADIVTGKGIAYKIPKIVVPTVAGEIDLEATPLKPTEVKVLNISTGVPIAGTLVDKKFTATTPADLAIGAKVKVMPYSYETAETATTITIDAKTFATGGKLVLQTYEKDASDRIVADIQIICERVTPDGSWDLATQSEVQAKDMKITMNILADDEGNYYKIVRVPRV